MKLILASDSPRRAEVLRNAGFTFKVVPARVDETRQPKEDVSAYIRRLAKAKARAAAASVDGDALIIGADTVVVVDGLVLGKPADAEDARQMLARLSGRAHEVLTGLAVLRTPGGQARFEQESTRVTFVPVSTKEIEEYVSSGEPFDKAGAYAIQGLGGRFVGRVEGCYFNVVGLPLARLYRLLRELGWSGPAS